MFAIAEYTASQSTPVAKNFANYMLDGTRDELIKAVSAFQKTNSQKLVCVHCQKENAENANYCDHCGNKLVKVCSCGERNNALTKFCQNVVIDYSLRLY